MPSEFDQIRFQVVMATLLENLGIKNRVCPFCKKRAFSAYEGGKGWQCFACKKKGGCFDLVIQLEGISLVAAKERLREMFRVPGPPPQRRPMELLDAWLDDLVVLQEGEATEEWAERCRNAIKGKFLESYKQGQKNKGP